MEAGDLNDLTPEEMVEAVLSDHKPSRNPLVRAIWIVLGIIFVVFAYIGILVPGWPTSKIQQSPK